MNIPITFPPVPARDLSEEALVMEAEIEGYLVRRIHIDEGASVEIMYEHCFNMLHLKIKARLEETQTTVSGFLGERVKPLGKIELDVCFEGAGRCRRAMMREEKKQAREKKKDPVEEMEPMGYPSPTKLVLVNPVYPEQLVKIGKNLSPEGSTHLKNLLKKSKDVFAWEPADTTRVPKRIIKHSLNVNQADKPVDQKRRVFSAEKRQVITREVSEWLKAGIVRRVKYPTWIANPVLVQKSDGSWRMCIDFKNLNSSCPKDYYPLPEIDSKIEAVMGYPLKYFLDAYKRCTAVAHPQANGLVERANMSLIKGIKTRLGRERKGWVDELPNVLWAHRTSLKTSNGETPYNLTFRSEAVIPAKVGMPTHRTMIIKDGKDNEEEIRLNLHLLTERREVAAIREDRYKTKVEQYYNKRVRPIAFKVREYVYRRNEASRVEDLGKLGPKWEGPYLVIEAYDNGSYKLQDMKGMEVPRTWHAINLRICYL
ncbi:reverse transcriptase domain-containing protein [Tanacetum coccineum]